MLTRNELWRLQYRQRRYLKQANQDALSQRLKDVIGNLTTLTSDGKTRVLPTDPDGVRWMTLFTHLHEKVVIASSGAAASYGPSHSHTYRTRAAASERRLERNLAELGIHISNDSALVDSNRLRGIVLLDPAHRR